MSEVNEKMSETVKTKDPRRVSAGKKGAEARKRNAELRRKETETIKKENMELKSITRDDEVSSPNSQNINIYKNYIPLCITVGVVGIGLYMYKSKQVVPQQPAPIIQQKEIDPFEFN